MRSVAVVPRSVHDHAEPRRDLAVHTRAQLLLEPLVLRRALAARNVRRQHDHVHHPDAEPVVEVTALERVGAIERHAEAHLVRYEWVHVLLAWTLFLVVPCSDHPVGRQKTHRYIVMGSRRTTLPAVRVLYHGMCVASGWMRFPQRSQRGCSLSAYDKSPDTTSTTTQRTVSGVQCNSYHRHLQTDPTSV